MLYAIQSGIITPSTKQRLEELEERKSSIETMIIQEEMTKPVIDHDVFVSWLTHFREYDTSDKEHRQRLVDHFVKVITDSAILFLFYEQCAFLRFLRKKALFMI